MNNRKNSSTAPLKTQAKALRSALAEEGIELTHSQSLHAIAKSHGFKNWNTALAAKGPTIDIQSAFDTLLSLGAPSDREKKPKVSVAWEPIHTEDGYREVASVVEDLATRERRAQEFRQGFGEPEGGEGFTLEEACMKYSDHDWVETDAEHEEWKNWQDLNPAWVKQVLETMVADHILRQEGDQYVVVPYNLMSLSLPVEEDVPGGMLDLLAGGVLPGDVFREWAACYVATASRYYDLAKLFDADPRLSIHDPLNDPPDTGDVEIWAPESMMKKIAESVGCEVMDAGSYLG